MMMKNAGIAATCLLFLVGTLSCAAADGTVKTKWGDARYVTHVPKARTQVAAVLYALTDDIRDAARCPIAKLNERGYGVIILDCTKLGGDKGSAWAAAIKGTKAALKDDKDIDAGAIGVILDKVVPGWDEKEENWMALADSYDRKGWNADPSKVAQTRPFKVMAWNLEGKSESEKELKSLTDLLKDINPDVVLISENYGKLPRIVSLMGGGWSGEAFSMNLAILSRWPIAKTSRPYEAPWNYLDPTGPFNFGLAELVVDGQRVRTCPLWLNWERGTPRFSTPCDEELSGILAAIKREIQESEDVPLVIGGDFNGYVEPHEKMMAAAGFTDTYRRFHPELNGTNVITWASHDGKRREFIDYIFSKGGKLRPTASEVFHSPWHKPFEYGGKKYESFPSDHGFVLTTFELARPAPVARFFKSVSAIGRDGQGAEPRAISVESGIPSDAEVLYDGTTLAKWRNISGGDPSWKIQPDGTLLVNKEGNTDMAVLASIYTRDVYTNFQMHVEYRIPEDVDLSDKWRGNSGVKIFGCYEVQIIDSYRNPMNPVQMCGAIYKNCPPLVNASQKPGMWQSYDIVFHAPTVVGGELRSRARLTVFHNGTLVQDNSQPPPYPDNLENRVMTSGSIELQSHNDHSKCISFRNVWIRRL